MRPQCTVTSVTVRSVGGRKMRVVEMAGEDVRVMWRWYTDTYRARHGPGDLFPTVPNNVYQPCNLQ